MKLSVIIPTAGNVERVIRTIKSFLKNDLKKFNIEIIITENVCLEKKSKELENFFLKLPSEFKYILDERPGSSEARNRAVQKCSGDLVAFIDDDVEISATWIETIFENFKYDKNLVFLGGPSIPRFTCSIPSWFWSMIYIDKKHWECHYLSILDFNKDQDNIDPKYIWGLNSVILKKYFIELGGYNPDRHSYALSSRSILRWAGDGDMGLANAIRKKKLKCVYRQKALVYHLCNEERLSFKYFQDRSYMQGIIDSYTSIRSTDEKYLFKFNFLKKIIILINSSIKKVYLSFIFFNNSEVKNFKISLIQNYINGWDFHQTEAKKSKDLLNWIKRKNYWDCDIRDEIKKLNNFEEF